MITQEERDAEHQLNIARYDLSRRQHRLRIARLAHHDGIVRFWADLVCESLDRVWEAQCAVQAYYGALSQHVVDPWRRDNPYPGAPSQACGVADAANDRPQRAAENYRAVNRRAEKGPRNKHKKNT